MKKAWLASLVALSCMTAAPGALEGPLAACELEQRQQVDDAHPLGVEGSPPHHVPPRHHSFVGGHQPFGGLRRHDVEVGEQHDRAPIPLPGHARPGRSPSDLRPVARSLDESRLDPVVKGEKYFNVEKFPTITYKSDTIKFDGDRVVRVEGELTMLGVTKPVALDVQNFTCGANPFNKKPMCGGQATATIKRSDFGMSAGLPYAPADEVRIIIPFEAYQAES